MSNFFYTADGQMKESDSQGILETMGNSNEPGYSSVETLEEQENDSQIEYMENNEDDESRYTYETMENNDDDDGTPYTYDGKEMEPSSGTTYESMENDDDDESRYTYDGKEMNPSSSTTYESMENNDDDGTQYTYETMENNEEDDGRIIENMSASDNFDLKGNLNLDGSVNAKGRLTVNSGKEWLSQVVQSDTDAHIGLKTKNDDGKNIYLINRDGHFRLHHHGVGDMFGVNKDGHTFINSGNNHLGLNVQSNVDSHILLRTKNDAKKDLYLINRDGHFRLHQGGVGDMFGVNKDGHHYVRHTGDHVMHVDGDGNYPYISLGKTGTWGGKKLYIQNVDAHTDEPIFRVGVHDKGPMMDMSLKHGARWRRKDGRWTHFDWVDNKNYIRGDTEHDGSLNVNGPVRARNAIHIDHNIGHPDNGDGTIYRADGQLQIATDDLIRLRHVGSKQTGIQFDTRPGNGDIHGPNGEMKITRAGIMLGGNNNGKEHNSAQISAGIHIPNSLNIVGMSSGKGHHDRRVDMWAEGGFNVYGKPNLNGRTDINSHGNHIGLNVQSNVDSHIQLKTKNDDNKNVYLINRDGHFRVHHHGVGDMFGVNKDGHTFVNSGNQWLSMNVQSNTDPHILLRTKNDARKDLYLINRDGHFRLHQGGVGDMFGVNKDGHHYVRHTGDHVMHVEGDGVHPYISLGKTGTWNNQKLYLQNVNAHTNTPIFRIGRHGAHPLLDIHTASGAVEANQGGFIANKAIQNGWISGNFGDGAKDRVVVGNLENVATVGSHNNALNAWRTLNLRGEQVNLTSHNGRINFSNGWNVRTGDGHFRLYHGDSQQFVVHNPHAGGVWSNTTWAPRMRTNVGQVVTEDTPIKLVTSSNGHHNGNWMHTHGDGVMRIAAPQYRTTYVIKPNA